MWKNKGFKLLVVVIFCLFMTTLQGCHTMKFEIENAPYEKVVEDTNWFYLDGWFPTREVDVSSKCPSGAAAIREQTTFGDGFISTISFGIVSPRSVSYYCLPEKKTTTMLFKGVSK
jgi:hypothetical protein